MALTRPIYLPAFAENDPSLDSELQKIASDAAHALQYSFLAAAATPQNTFPRGSVEEQFRLAIATRKPERMAVYQTKAREIAGKTIDARQALFGRYATLDIEEYARLGHAASIARLPPLQLDLVKLQAAARLLAAPTRISVSPPAVAGPGPVLAPPTPPPPPPSPSPLSPTSIGFYITEVRCVDETDPEIGHDEIALGGLAVDESGNTFKIDPFSVSEYFLENAGQAVYPDVNHDVTVLTYPQPGKLFHQFDPTKVTFWPKHYSAILFITEVDSGGFASFLTDAWQTAAPVIKQQIEDAIGKAGGIFGPIGAVVGKVFGKVLGWVIDQVISLILGLFEDDVSLPGTASVELTTASGAAYFNSNGWSNFSTAEGSFDFQWAGGEYQVKCRWEVKVPGYIIDTQTFHGHYVGVFRAGTDPFTLWVGDWASFTNKWQELSKANLRLVSLETYLDGNTRLYAGVFRAGTDKHALWANVEWADFSAEWKTLSDQGLRLINLQTYVDGGRRLYAGVFRAGTDAHLLTGGLDWQSFGAKCEAESNQGLRLVNISSYSEGGKPFFHGVFRAGTDPHFLWASDWTGFTAKWAELRQGGLRLVDLDTYTENGKQMFIGAFRAGTDADLLWNSDWAGFIPKWQEANKGGLRLIDLACY